VFKPNEPPVRSDSYEEAKAENSMVKGSMALSLLPQFIQAAIARCFPARGQYLAYSIVIKVAVKA
jgi:hypothetical protein